MKLLTLKQNADFRRLYYRGKSASDPVVAVYAKKNRMDRNRIGITVSVKIGNAVVRTRARRVIREGYRSVEKRLPVGYDFVFVARGRTPFAKSGEVGEAICELVERLGLK
ncbi:MAG: ribonuclease P protein component [Clostridia bacterium]|nr:ribonuclease P protein component [Clostridia bacterium]MBR5942884.1 ribonuclease P protein component [Clostridia bacterium]